MGAVVKPGPQCAKKLYLHDHFDILKDKTLKINVAFFKDNKSQLIYLGILQSNPIWIRNVYKDSRKSRDEIMTVVET